MKINKLNILLLIIIFFNCNIIFSQEKDRAIDSMTQLLARQAEDSSKVLTYNKLASKYYQSNPKKSIELAELGLAISKKINFEKGIARSCKTIALAQYYQANYSESLKFYFEALKYYEKLKDKKNTAGIYSNIGSIHWRLSEFSQAIAKFRHTNAIACEIHDSDLISATLLNIGAVFDIMGQPDSALIQYKSALSISIKLNDIESIGFIQNNIGMIYAMTEQFTEAISYFTNSIVYLKQTNNSYNLSNSYINLARIYLPLKKYEIASKYLDSAKYELHKTGGKELFQDVYYFYYQIDSAQGKFESALLNYKIYTKYVDSIFNAEKSGQIADMQTKYETEKKEQQILLNNIEIKQKNTIINYFIFFTIIIIIFSILLFKLYTQKKAANQLLEVKNTEINHQKDELAARAVELGEYIEELRVTQDIIEEKNHQLEKLSIVARETDNAIIIFLADGTIEWVNEGFTRIYGFSFAEFIESGSNIFEIGKNEKVKDAIKMVLETKQSVIYENEFEHKNGSKVWAQTTLTPTFTEDNEISKIISVDANITKLKEAEIRINQQKERIETQRDEISRQKNQITDSIRYASRIQLSMLPGQEILENLFPQNVLLYIPRDIISGDFYWLAQVTYSKTTYKIVIVADCTGHGVPGALMSMLGISLLNEIVYRKGVRQANLILDELRKNLKRSLHQTGKSDEAKDGIDISLCIIDTSTLEMQYAGANNMALIYREQPILEPIINGIVKDHQLFELKGDRQPIGIYLRELPFTNIEFQLQKNDSIYLFSDGYFDQLGIEGKKMLLGNFKSLLMSAQDKNIKEQKEFLNLAFDTWKGENIEQLDDILVLGFKV